MGSLISKDKIFAIRRVSIRRRRVWTDWRYDLLKCGICLCDEKSAKKLEKVLDTLLEISREDYYPEYTKKEDLIVRYLLHRHLYDKKNTQKELYQNIAINELRIIATSKSDI